MKTVQETILQNTHTSKLHPRTLDKSCCCETRPLLARWTAGFQRNASRKAERFQYACVKRQLTGQSEARILQTEINIHYTKCNKHLRMACLTNSSTRQSRWDVSPTRIILTSKDVNKEGEEPQACFPVLLNVSCRWFCSSAERVKFLEQRTLNFSESIPGFP